MDNGINIYRAAEACRKEFDACMADPVLRESVVTIRSVQGDYNLWCSSISATSQGKASLDYRLRNHRDVRNTVCELLAALSASLRRWATRAAVVNADPESHVHSVIDPIKEETDSPTSADSPTSWDAISDEWSNADSDEYQDFSATDPIIAECISYVKTTLDQLARLSLTIRKAGNKFRFGRVDAELDTDAYEPFRNHLTSIILRACFDPEAENLPAVEKMKRVANYEALTPIQRQLVHVNILRRHRIDFITNSRKKGKRLAVQNIGLVKDSGRLGEAEVSRISSISGTQTSRQTLDPSSSQTAQSGILKGLQTPLAAPKSAPTATDVDSRIDVKRLLKALPSSNITKVTKIRKAQSYPDRPTQSSDGLLICPYCDDVLPSSCAEGDQIWRSHVAQDLMPYSCFFDGCETPYETYLTSENLIAHVLAKHSKSCWTCNFCEPGEHTDINPLLYTPLDFWSADDWIDHVTTAHSDRIRVTHLSVLAELSRRSILGPQACPLCDFATSIAAPRVDDHILQHLHEFSLRALPEILDINADDRSKTSQVSDALSHVLQLEQKEAQDPTEYYPIEKSLWVRELNELMFFYPSTPLESVLEAVKDFLQRTSLDIGSVEFWAFQMLKVSSALESVRSTAGRQNEMVMSKEMTEDIVEQLRKDLRDSLELSGVSFYQKNPGNESVWRFAIPEAPNLALSVIQEGMKDNVCYHLFVQDSIPDQQPRVLLSGSGSSKTLIAGQLARQIVDRGDCSVFWITATSLSSVSHAYSRILELLLSRHQGLDTERFLVYYFNWLLRGQWLMVLNNIDGQTLLNMQLKGWLPSGVGGRLLLTSEDTSCVNLLGQVTEVRIPPREDIYSDLHVVPSYSSIFKSRSDMHSMLGPDSSRSSHSDSHTVPAPYVGRRSSTSALRWICPSCTNGSNNSWEYDLSCPFCFNPRPAAPQTFHG